MLRIWAKNRFLYLRLRRRCDIALWWNIELIRISNVACNENSDATSYIIPPYKIDIISSVCLCELVCVCVCVCPYSLIQYINIICVFIWQQYKCTQTHLTTKKKYITHDLLGNECKIMSALNPCRVLGGHPSTRPVGRQ